MLESAFDICQGTPKYPQGLPGQCSEYRIIFRGYAQFTNGRDQAFGPYHDLISFSTTMHSTHFSVTTHCEKRSIYSKLSY